MDMIDRYLNAVAAQLPQAEREDIVAELRDLILSRFEAREEELGRALNDDEKEAILREIGHPLVVAARYRKGPDALVGREMFPYWLFGVKAGLMVLAAVFVLGLVVRLIGGSGNFGQDIAQSFHGFFGAGLTLIGAATLAAATFEHYGIRPKWLTEWKVRDLGVFGLADTAQWSSAVGVGSAKAAAAAKTQSGALRPRREGRWPGSEAVGSLIVNGLFVLWWIGALHFPGFAHISMRGDDVAVSGAPIWAALHGAILVYALAHVAVDLVSLAQPYAVRLRAACMVPLHAAGLWLIWTIFQAGHWFDLSVNGQTAQITGGDALLNVDALKALDRLDGASDLTLLAGNLSVVMTWVLAVAAFGLVCALLHNLWRAFSTR